MRSNHTIAVTALAAASLGLMFWLLQAVPTGAAAQAVLVAGLVVVGLVVVGLVVGGLVVGGLTPAAGALHGLRPVGPAGFWPAPLFRRGHRHGCGFERREGPDAFFRAERFERLIAEVENRMSFTEPQAAAWAGLVPAVRAGARSIGDAGRALAEQRDAPVAPVAPARLSGLETMLAVGLDAVRDLRPPFSAFYATLDRHQKTIIDDLFAHARRG